jgi:Putative peptidoglycan binding domain
MKRLLLLGTIAALALTTTGQAQSVEQRQVERPAVARHSVNTQTRAFAPSSSRNVVRSYRNGGRYYYNGGRYYGGYYYNQPFASVGFGGYYPGYYDYPYAYGYGYPYNYGYGYTYPSDYYADQYPTGYATTTYRTSTYGDLAYDDNLVVAVQERLKRAGYYLGAIDGVAGPETRSAIARWEGNHGMTADGRIDQRTLRSMGLG